MTGHVEDSIVTGHVGNSILKFSVAFDGSQPPERLAEIAQAADQAGAGTLWVASHLFQRDPIVNAAMMLSKTAHVSAALMAMSPFAMHPVHITMAAAALDEWFPGRVALCFGVGAPRDLAAVGLNPDKPLRAISESIAIARTLLDGGTVSVNGERFRAHGRRLSSGKRDVPIVLAASGPKMLQLAGSEADGVVISAATSPRFIAWALTQVAIGEANSRRRIHKAALVYGALGTRDHLRRNLGFILRGGHHAPNLALAGTKLDQKALAQAFAAEDWPTVDRLIDDSVLDNHTASGTTEQVRSAFRAYAQVGLDEIVLAGVPSGPELRALLQITQPSPRPTPA